VRTGRGQSAAIRGKRQRMHRARVAGKDTHSVAALHVPQAHCAFFIAGAARDNRSSARSTHLSLPPEWRHVPVRSDEPVAR